MKYYIGCSGFYNKDWKGDFYPKGLSQSKWFEHYCTQFNSLELNTTFYRFPTVDMLQKWYDRSPSDFKFSAKAPRLITHYKQFNETERLLNDFYTAVKDGLKEKLGAVLFQFPAKIIYSESFLEKIIQSVSEGFTNVFEFRHTSWWNKKVFNELKQNNISFCGESIKNLPDKIAAGTSTIYYRFHGLEKLYYSEYSIEAISKFAKELKRKKAETVFVFFNNTATMAAIRNANQLETLLKY